MCKCEFGKCSKRCECRCHIAIEAHCTHSFKVGISSGLERAAGLLMQEATEAFKCGRDEEALQLRTWSEKLAKKGDEEHPGPNPTYPDEE